MFWWLKLEGWLCRWWLTLEIQELLGGYAGVVCVWVGNRPDLGVYMMATYAWYQVCTGVCEWEKWYVCVK